MARNEEKSQSMLNRYLQMKNESKTWTKPKEKRPHMASMENSLPKAEQWRRQIIREISVKIAEIQNETLGEAKIREINDDINKLLREKSHWERRIRELGGASYRSAAYKIAMDEGEEAEGGMGYRYFGAAKNLPGVKELLKPPEDKGDKKKKTRAELYKNIDTDYFGYRDDDDGVLEKLEIVAEKRARAALIQEWKQNKRQKTENENESSEEDDELDSFTTIAVPTKQEMEKILLEKQKQEVLNLYAIPALRRAIIAEPSSRPV